MPASKHRRRGKTRSHSDNQEANGSRFSPELAAELTLLHDFLSIRHGNRRWTRNEIGEALAALSNRLPLSNRLAQGIDSDPEGDLAWVLAAAAQG